MQVNLRRIVENPSKLFADDRWVKLTGGPSEPAFLNTSSWSPRPYVVGYTLVKVPREAALTRWVKLTEVLKSTPPQIWFPTMELPEYIGFFLNINNFFVFCLRFLLSYPYLFFFLIGWALCSQGQISAMEGALIKNYINLFFCVSNQLHHYQNIFPIDLQIPKNTLVLQNLYIRIIV